MTSENQPPLHRHPRPFAEVRRRYRAIWSRPGYPLMVATGAAALVASWFINYVAIQFATERASNSVTDIVLSNIPVFEVDGLFVYGTFFFALLGIGIIFSHPKHIPFAFKAVALFWVIRSVFTAVTHFAPFEAYYMTDFGPAINNMFFGGDLFFSAHTGMPFLGALAFWRIRGVRNIFLIGSAYFAVVVLLGHLHYSIDVLSAFFITYGIYHIARWLFPKESALFHSETEVPR